MNPYFEEARPFLCLPGEDYHQRLLAELDRGYDGFTRRRDLVAKYAWAVPTDTALEALVDRAPVVEIGAGSGYWACLLRARGVTVHAYDTAIGEQNAYGHKDCWTRVEPGDEEAARRHPEATLFLCWPPYSSAMALRALRRYKGQRVVYIGEGDSGCTASTGFHQALERWWDEEAVIALPQWPGIHDRMYCYRRKVSALRTVSKAGASSGATQTQRPRAS